jgi:hypothetical protein
LGLVPKSPIHIGLISAKNLKPNISHLGPFKSTCGFFSCLSHFLLNFLCVTIRFRQKAWDEEDFAHEEEDDNPDAVDSDPDGGVHMHRGNGSQPASSFQPSCDTVSPETRFSLPLRYVHLVSFKYFALDKFVNVLFKGTVQHKFYLSFLVMEHRVGSSVRIVLREYLCGSS